MKPKLRAHWPATQLPKYGGIRDVVRSIELEAPTAFAGDDAGTEYELRIRFSLGHKEHVLIEAVSVIAHPETFYAGRLYVSRSAPTTVDRIETRRDD